MIKEYIMQVTVDDDGHEHGLTRKEELIRCRDCEYAEMTYNDECKYCDIWFPDEKIYMPGDFYCGRGRRKKRMMLSK